MFQKRISGSIHSSRSFDLKTYKPMGFESSFLKFIQESEEKEDDFDDWELQST